MLFRTHFKHKLDPKSRVAVPASWRAAFDCTLILLDARHDGYQVVKCFTDASFDAKIDYIRRDAASMGAEPGEVDRYVGNLIGLSTEAMVSTQGKLLIPKPQRERLKLGDEAVLVGRGDHFEIWLPEDFEAANAPQATSAFDKRYRMLD